MRKAFAHIQALSICYNASTVYKQDWWQLFATNDMDLHLNICLILYIIFRKKWVQTVCLYNLCSYCTHFLEYFLLLFVLLFKVSYLALKGTYSYAAQQIRLTSSKLLGIDPWLCSNSRLEIPREKAHKSRAIKTFPSELRKVPALWSVHTVFLLCASKHLSSTWILKHKLCMCIRKDRKACIAQVVSTITKASSHLHYTDAKKQCKPPPQTKKVSEASLSSYISLPSKTSSNSKQTCSS